MESAEQLGTATDHRMASPTTRVVLITCEHAGYEIPPEVAGQFAISLKVLTSHRGYDRGAREIALALGEQLNTSPLLCTVTRLVVDLNRSESFSGLFSGYGRLLDNQAREEILQQHYRPFRNRVRAAIAEQIAASLDVRHFSVHTFTPVLRGDRRTADIGLLFDPARAAETELATAWSESLARRWPQLSVKMNYPYLGTDDGHTTSLRAIFPDPRYAGIELEVNQKWARGSSERFAKLLRILRQSLVEAIAQAN